MLDKTLPFKPVLMEKNDPERYPCFDLPAGFSFRLYQPGDEADWCRLQLESGQIESLEKAQCLFRDEFMTRPDLLARQCIFVENDASGHIVATTSVWPGDHFGEEKQRIHWVTVETPWQGRGLAKALMTRAFTVYNEQGYRNYIYLATQTWSYKAIHLYLRFGFTAYLGPKPVNWSHEGGFVRERAAAWRLIAGKIAVPVTWIQPDIGQPAGRLT